MPTATTRTACRHCSHPLVNRPRGLCWRCYYTPGVREHYHNPSRYARRGVGSVHTGPPGARTDQPPGTVGKVLVMQVRARLGQDLFHPDDARGFDEGQGVRTQALPREGYATAADRTAGHAPAAGPVVRVAGRPRRRLA
jgi:hypothetical protein